MSTTPGTRIGSYEVTREIGRGGMGVVYLARDTKLDRDVAIKCLPEDFVDDQERLSRFHREAKALASLNHSNIAAIYGLEEADSKQYLILEYVPGETLSQVLDHGPMPVSEALPIAKQIAEAIEAAHSNGIIHRDLKPANIKFASDDQVKVLDFGLAKAFEERPSSATDIAASPTYIPANTPTMPGVVLGTAGYLSPEQARGRTVDKRTDIFSFGCVLYEMLVGKTVFPGETVTDSLGATLHKEPTWDDLPQDTPPTIILLLRKCLAKDRKRRLQDIGDARIELEQAIDDPTSTSLGLAAFALSSTKSPRLKLWHLLSAAALIVLAAVATWVFKPAPQVEPKQVVRFSIPLEKQQQRLNFSLSPDGTKLVYSTRSASHSSDSDESQPTLLLRRLDTLEATPIPNTEGGIFPTFSPNGKRILFVSDLAIDGPDHRAELKIVELDGRPPITIGTSALDHQGPSWITNDEIVYIDSANPQRLMRVSAQGGDPKLLIDFEAVDSNMPLGISTLPGGQWLAVTTVELGDTLTFSSKLVEVATGKLHPFLTDGVGPTFIPDGPVIFYRPGTVLMASDIDMTANPPALTGELSTLLDGAEFSFDNLSFDISNNGHLVVSGDQDQDLTTLATVDSQGNVEAFAAEARQYMGIYAFSPDGTRLAYAGRGDDPLPEVWVMELDTGNVRRLSNEGNVAVVARWLDNGRLVYGRIGEAFSLNLQVIEMRRNAKPQPLFSGDEHQEGTSRTRDFDITPDGSVIVYELRFPDEEGSDIWLRAVDGSDEPQPLMNSEANEANPHISPDGKWLCFESDERGRTEVYIRPLLVDEAAGDQLVPISRAGGRRATWSGDSTKIYFADSQLANLYVVEIRVTDGAFLPSEPKLVSDLETLGVRDGITMFTSVPDSDRILFVKEGESTDDEGYRMDIVLNWLEEYKSNKARSN